jgi:hypothetical protein
MTQLDSWLEPRHSGLVACSWFSEALGRFVIYTYWIVFHRFDERHLVYVLDFFSNLINSCMDRLSDFALFGNKGIRVNHFKCFIRRWGRINVNCSVNVHE